MNRNLFLTVLLLLICMDANASKVTVEQTQATKSYLANREILCTADFAVNSTDLAPDARLRLSRCVPQLKQVDLTRKIIRIEGFASPDGDKLKNYRLSIERARAVESFLRLDHGVSLDHYITGYGPTEPAEISSAGTRRVEIVIYDNPWDQQDVPVETTGR